ncbi:MAG TPA: methyl-accepting chemotaxis protein [Candidatus Competibacteraceae bacterium]|nr:methyl-accepting chemotaxis protein [Candidatus Competibacteraceae bacterium]
MKETNSLNTLAATIRAGLLDPVNGVNLGTLSWEEAGQRLASAMPQVERIWNDYLATIDEDTKDSIQYILGPEMKNITKAFAESQDLVKRRDRTRLALFLTNDLSGLTTPFFDALQAQTTVTQQQANEAFQKAQETNSRFLVLLTVLGIAGIVLTGFLGAYLYKSISTPLRRLSDTVREVATGDFNARTAVTGSDELAALGQAFDQLLDERVAALVKAQQENEKLNDSIILLLQAVSQLSQRDLTIKVPVNEDITGPMADALNLMTTETAKVLADVTHVSEEVASASDKVKVQSDTVIAVANEERQEVERAAAELAAAAEDMNRIADLARTCNQTAESAIETTRKALDTVVGTVDGITGTRDTIRETEKRIKRLGERSQEISGVVNLINTIAERTHILALNASMHAASAGEAGRGFAVVADEVQRLAENAREATSQIATLVSSIQVETADTVNAMNQAISQVVEGSRLAEQAGDQMKKTQQTTADLVASVQQIAARSQEQARISNALLERAKQIQNSTLQTSQRLREQSQYTGNLVKYAKALVDSVRVFKLPAREVPDDRVSQLIRKSA